MTCAGAATVTSSAHIPRKGSRRGTNSVCRARKVGRRSRYGLGWNPDGDAFEGSKGLSDRELAALSGEWGSELKNAGLQHLARSFSQPCEVYEVSMG